MVPTEIPFRIYPDESLSRPEIEVRTCYLVVSKTFYKYLRRYYQKHAYDQG